MILKISSGIGYGSKGWRTSPAPLNGESAGSRSRNVHLSPLAPAARHPFQAAEKMSSVVSCQSLTSIFPRWQNCSTAWQNESAAEVPQAGKTEGLLFRLWSCKQRGTGAGLRKDKHESRPLGPLWSHCPGSPTTRPLVTCTSNATRMMRPLSDCRCLTIQGREKRHPIEHRENSNGGPFV